MTLARRIFTYGALGSCLLLLGHALAQPSPRGFASMVYDIESELIVLFGGVTGNFQEESGHFKDETWVLDPATGAWEQRFPDPAPPGLFFPNLAYDERSDRVVLWGGENYSGRSPALWSYDTNANTWERHEVPEDEGPPERYGSRMVYHRGVEKIFLFGGHGRDYVNDTWSLDLTSATWMELGPSDPPAVRNEHHLAYDDASETIVLWSGDVPSGPDRSIWLYDPTANTWTQREAPETAPESRRLAGFAALGEDGHLLLHGGRAGGPTGDTWRYDVQANEWTTVPGEGPGPRSAFALANAQAHGVFLFGGAPGSDLFEFVGDTWRFDPTTNVWTRP